MSLRIWKIKVVFYLLVCIAILITVNTNILRLQLSDDSFSELSKCPACYGTNLCSAMRSGDIHLTGLDSWIFYRHLNVKNVFHGFWKSKNQSVIIKKLGYDSELEEFEGKLKTYTCHRVDNCDSALAVNLMVNKTVAEDQQYLKLEELEKIFKTLEVGPGPDFLKCGDQDLLNWIIKSCLVDKSQPSLENILTMLLINQEPLIAMAFPPELQFPFPEYHGACGLLSVFSDAGTSISQLSLSSSWPLRAAISLDLIQLANSLSKTSHNLAIYPTDWDPGHLYVDKDTGMVRLVDLENIVIVNLTKDHILPQHKSDNYGCEDCYSYSIPDLCQHSSSDHNIYSVCANILSTAHYSVNLLQNPPNVLLEKYRSFPGLLDSCWKGGLKQRLDTRKRAARNLEKILMEQIELEEDLF